MAKKYHPLDVRYKGPSTAFTGNARREKTGFDSGPAPLPKVPPKIAKATAAKTPPPPRRAPKEGPWAPAPSAPVGHAGPPPLPRYEPTKRPNSARRVMIGLLIMGLFVGANILATRVGLSALKLDTQLQSIDL